MPATDARRTVFTQAEAIEIRGLLDQLGANRLADRRMSAARLRHLGVPEAARSDNTQFDQLISSGTIQIDDGAARAAITPQSGRVFRVAVGVTGDSIDEDWSAFNQRFHWFGRQPQSLASGDHLFVLAVDRWRSAVVGLYEAVSAGAERLPNSPDPDRWPFALGVRPLAAIPPPQAVRVDRQQGPQSGLPVHVHDETAISDLYAAVSPSPPPPGPMDLEQRVEELEAQDVGEDILEAVAALGSEAHQHAVAERAIQLGNWSVDELAARAWYTDSGYTTHIEQIVNRAIQIEYSMSHRIERDHGGSPYRIAQDGPLPFGLPYRPAGDREPASGDTGRIVDIAALDKATRRHMELQDQLANELHRRGVEARSPGSWEPKFDLVFKHDRTGYVVEVKSGNPVASHQVRIGVGQVLEYTHIEAAQVEFPVQPVLLLETAPPDPWPELCDQLGIRLLVANDLADSLSALLSQGPDANSP